MSEQPNSLREDIAFLRGLAEQGRAGPLAGGSILAASGFAFGSASLAIWAGGRGGWLTHGWQAGLIWLAASAVFTAAVVAVQRGAPPRGPGPRAVGVAWSGAGFACFTIGLSLAVMAIRAGDPLVIATGMPFMLSIYGACFFVAAAITRTRWLYAVTFGAFGMALVNAWFATEGAILYLLYGLSLYGLAGVPGLVLMRQARKAA